MKPPTQKLKKIMMRLLAKRHQPKPRKKLKKKSKKNKKKPKKNRKLRAMRTKRISSRVHDVGLPNNLSILTKNLSPSVKKKTKKLLKLKAKVRTEVVRRIRQIWLLVGRRAPWRK